MGRAAWLSSIITESNLFKENQVDKKGKATFSVKKSSFEMTDKPENRYSLKPIKVQDAILVSWVPNQEKKPLTLFSLNYLTAGADSIP